MDDDLFAATRVGTTLCQKWHLEKLLGVGGMAAGEPAERAAPPLASFGVRRRDEVARASGSS